MIFEVVKQLLSELFLDAEERNVSFYAGDLFESSHFKLRDVFLKTALINALQLPFELSAGYVGHVKVEGLVGAVAGWPLQVSVNDVCLVLKPRTVQWDNELLIRYARELFVAICQSFGAPSAFKKDNVLFVSPAKWLWSRIQAVGAEMVVQVERIHLRVESLRGDKYVAFGLYIPLIRFAPREVEEQILYRRQQPGVTYPKAADDVVSKLFTFENVSFYADLDADVYWTAPSESDASSKTIEHPLAAALLASHKASTSPRHYALENAYKHLKKYAQIPYTRDQQRELAFIRVIWVKLDLKRTRQIASESEGPAKPVLVAIDITTEEIEVNVDFSQIAVILEQVEHVANYFERVRTWKWRPSCIDRENQVPPSVKVLPNAVFPLPLASDEERSSVVFSIDKQRKSRLWFRAMWRYAFRCVVDQNQRKSKLSRAKMNASPEIDRQCWWHNGDIVEKELRASRRQRYIHLFARSLTPAAMEIALYGRRKTYLGLGIQETSKDQPLPPSPRRRPLPKFEALTLEEQWELSDFVATMPVYEQRLCRALAERALRKDFTLAPPSPTRKVSSAMECSVPPTDLNSDRSPHHGRSCSVDSVSPALTCQPLPSIMDAGFKERQHKRALTISFGDSELSYRAASPPSRFHSASTSALPSPTKQETALSLEPLRAWIYKPRQTEPHATSSFEQHFFPTWLLNPAKVVPLFNWQIGPVTVHLSKGSSDDAQTMRCGLGIEIGIESCTGALLLSRAPFTRILVEMRVGLFHMTLVRQPHLRDPGNVATQYKWITSDCIRLPKDGFFYIGLKYSAQEVAEPGGRAQSVGDLKEELGLKGRICIGPVKIDCNEAAMRTAVGQTVADELRASNVDVSTSTHFSVLQDAYRSFVNLVAQLPTTKDFGQTCGVDIGPDATPSESNVAAQDQTAVTRNQHKLNKTKSQWIQMLNALLLRSSTFEVEVGTLELNQSAFITHIDSALSVQVPKIAEISKAPEIREDVNVILPMMIYRLQNRPSTNECIVDAAGARIVYRSTQQGRAAVIRHIAHIFKL